jgi:predicted LPLAT superfamily acyltransferase
VRYIDPRFKKAVLKRLEALGHGIFYLTLRIVGQPGAYALLIPVVLTYVSASRRIHQLIFPYLQRRFPKHNPVERWQDTFRICHSFGQILVDRAWLGLSRSARLHCSLDGWDTILELIEQGKGLVLLTAHVGNWQVALAHLKDLPVPVYALMHYEEEVVAKHYFDLCGESCPFRIIKTDGFLGGVVEATAAIQRGEVVTIMGDRLAGGPSATVKFLDSRVRFPAGVYRLAAATGAPVAVLLAAKTGRQSYHLRLWDVFHPSYRNREHREEDLTAWTNRFSKALEAYVTQFPYQWYNFYDFWNQ